MGGEVLELMDDKVERCYREGLQEGYLEGLLEVYQELILLEAKKALSMQMKAHGIDQKAIAEMMANTEEAINHETARLRKDMVASALSKIRQLM